MNVFERRIPWTHSDWWTAGRTDAMMCIEARYDGSDMCEEVLAAYIHGYGEGTRLTNRTVKCPNLKPSEPFTFEETSIFVPGYLPEGWDLLFHFVGPALRLVFALVGVVYVILWIIGRY